jgi:hypothetical protein
MDRDGSSPAGVIAEALAELEEIMRHHRRSGNAERLMADLGRWKRRTSDALRDHVSAVEGDAFDRLELQPFFNLYEPIDGPVGRYRAHLESLHEDLRRRRSISGQSEKSPAREQSPGPAMSPSEWYSPVADDTPVGAIIERAMAEAWDIRERHREGSDRGRIEVELLRWKRRTAAALREQVSNAEADAFDQLELHPGMVREEGRLGEMGMSVSYMKQETLDDVIARHLTFLETLHEDEYLHPPRGQRVSSALEQEPSPAGVAQKQLSTPVQAPRAASPLLAQSNLSLLGSFIEFLERERRQRGVLWTFILAVLGLIVGILSLF